MVFTLRTGCAAINGKCKSFIHGFEEALNCNSDKSRSCSYRSPPRSRLLYSTFIYIYKIYAYIDVVKGKRRAIVKNFVVWVQDPARRVNNLV